MTETKIEAPEENEVVEEEEEEEEEEDDGVFRIKVKSTAKSTTLEVDPDASLDKIESQLREATGVPPDNRLMMFKEGVRLEGESLSSLQIESGDVVELKHKLNRKWTMWYDTPPRPGKKVDADNWHLNVKKIMNFNTVEDYWGLFNNLTTPSKLPPASNYYMFMTGVMPAWEDPHNAKGGMWVLQCNTSMGDKKMLDEVWLHTILEVIGEGFDDSAEITGMCVNLRKQRNRITIWTKATDNGDALKRLGQQFRERMNVGSRYKLTFAAHKSKLNTLYEV